jgi:hypothetical protein
LAWEQQVDDLEVVARINELTEEEHRLQQAHVGTPLSGEELTRLRAVEVALDQCWDLLRQRRARRTAGGDPEAAELRSGEVVEHYRQ